MAIVASPSKWSGKQYTMAALGGSLAVVAIVAIVAAALSPASIYFSVADFDDKQDINESYNLTIAANTSSRRAKVEFRGMSVEIWPNTAEWFPAELNRSALPELPPRETINISVPVNFGRREAAGGMNQNASSYLNHSNLYLVVVNAQVWFRFGCSAQTRIYSIRVYCHNVTLFGSNMTYFPVPCKA